MESVESKVDEPFGRQPLPVHVIIDGHEQDVYYWERRLKLAAEFKGDLVERKQALNLYAYPRMEARFTIFPRAIND